MLSLAGLLQDIADTPGQREILPDHITAVEGESQDPQSTTGTMAAEVLNSFNIASVFEDARQKPDVKAVAAAT